MKHPFPNDKKEVIRWAQQLMRTPSEWVILDTETTGLGKTDEIIEIAIIDGLGHMLLNTLIKPKRKTINPGAAQVHGITMEMLKDSPRLPDVLPRIQEVVRDKKMVFYNGKFDLRMLDQTSRKYDKEELELPVSEVTCAMGAYSAFCGEINLKYKDYTWQKLPGAGHRAADDCYATLAVIQKMANDTSFEKTELQSSSLRVFKIAIIGLGILFLILFLLLLFTDEKASAFAWLGAEAALNMLKGS